MHRYRRSQETKQCGLKYGGPATPSLHAAAQPQPGPRRPQVSAHSAGVPARLPALHWAGRACWDVCTPLESGFLTSLASWALALRRHGCANSVLACRGSRGEEDTAEERLSSAQASLSLSTPNLTVLPCSVHSRAVFSSTTDGGQAIPHSAHPIMALGFTPTPGGETAGALSWQGLWKEGLSGRACPASVHHHRLHTAKALWSTPLQYSLVLVCYDRR